MHYSAFWRNKGLYLLWTTRLSIHSCPCSTSFRPSCSSWSGPHHFPTLIFLAILFSTLFVSFPLFHWPYFSVSPAYSLRGSAAGVDAHPFIPVYIPWWAPEFFKWRGGWGWWCRGWRWRRRRWQWLRGRTPPLPEKQGSLVSFPLFFYIEDNVDFKCRGGVFCFFSCFLCLVFLCVIFCYFLCVSSFLFLQLLFHFKKKSKNILKIAWKIFLKKRKSWKNKKDDFIVRMFSIKYSFKKFLEWD